MSLSTPKLRDFAQQLLAGEVPPNSLPASNGLAACRVCEKLRQPLSALAGIAGFRALMAHALSLAKAEAPCLDAVRVEADGSLEGLGDPELKQEDAPQGGVVLVAQLIGLLVLFIGEALTLRLVKSEWPDAAFNNIEDSHEKERS